MENTLTLQLHYYFEDPDRHSMDAYLRNENERDVLAILRAAVEVLGVDGIKIELVPPDEGGFIDKYILSSKGFGIATIILTSFGLYLHQQMNNSQIQANNSQIELNNSQIETNRTQIEANKSQIKVNESQDELNRLQIEEIEEERRRKSDLRKKITPLQSNTLTKQDADTLSKEISANVADSLSKDYKANWHRSKFFDRSYKTVTKIETISTQILDETNTPINEELKIPRGVFKEYVLKNTNIPAEIHKDAIIEMISPVIYPIKMAWHGIYNGEIIKFHMRDTAFINRITIEQIKFTRGTKLRCVLEQKRKIDDSTGLIKVTQNNVLAATLAEDTKTTLVVPPVKKRGRPSKQGGEQQQLLLTISTDDKKKKPKRK